MNKKTLNIIYYGKPRSHVQSQYINYSVQPAFSTLRQILLSNRFWATRPPVAKTFTSLYRSPRTRHGVLHLSPGLYVCPFRVLELAPTFELDSAMIHSRKRALLRVHHPDAQPSSNHCPSHEGDTAENRSAAISSAAAELLDPVKRILAVLAAHNLSTDLSVVTPPVETLETLIRLNTEIDLIIDQYSTGEAVDSVSPMGHSMLSSAVSNTSSLTSEGVAAMQELLATQLVPARATAYSHMINTAAAAVTAAEVDGSKRSVEGPIRVALEAIGTYKLIATTMTRIGSTVARTDMGSLHHSKRDGPMDGDSI